MASTSRVGCLFFMLLGALLRICTHTHTHTQQIARSFNICSSTGLGTAMVQWSSALRIASQCLGLSRLNSSYHSKKILCDCFSLGLARPVSNDGNAATRGILQWGPRCPKKLLTQAWHTCQKQTHDARHVSHN